MTSNRATSVFRYNGPLYLGGGDSIIYADGSGLKAASVPVGTISGGTANYVASYDGDGILTSGRIASDMPLAGALVQYDSTGGLSGVVNFSGGMLNVDTDIVSNGSVVVTGTIQCAYSSTVTDAATVQYVLDQISTVAVGYTWLEPAISFWDASAALPATPANGDRYICSVAGNGWVKNTVYQYNLGTTTWIAHTPVINDAITDKSGPISYIYINPGGTGANWSVIGFNGAHDSLAGKSQTNAGSTSTVTITSNPINPNGNGKILVWQTTTGFVWEGYIKLVGVSDNGTGDASFTWGVQLKNAAGTLVIEKLSQHSSVSGDLSTVTADISVDGTFPNYINVNITRAISDGLQTTWHAVYETVNVNLP